MIRDSFLVGQQTYPSRLPPGLQDVPSGPDLPALQEAVKEQVLERKVLTGAELAKKCRKGRTKGESDSQFFGRVSQLHLENKGLTRMPDSKENPLLHSCVKVRALFLDGNHLSVLDNIGFAKRLYDLYAKNNRLESVMDLVDLGYLERVFLEGNRLAFLDTIFPRSLTELFLSDQGPFPDPRDQLSFSVEASHSLATLRVLHIQGNNISNLQFLHPLVSLVELNASDNNVTALREVGVLCGELASLEKLDLTNNPVCKDKEYRVHVLLGAMRLWELDGKEVAEKERFYLRRRYLGPAQKPQRSQQQQQQQQALRRGGGRGPVPINRQNRNAMGKQSKSTIHSQHMRKVPFSGLGLTGSKATQHSRGYSPPMVSTGDFAHHSSSSGQSSRFILSSNSYDQRVPQQQQLERPSEPRYGSSTESPNMEDHGGWQGDDQGEQPPEVFIPLDYIQTMDRPQAANGEGDDRKTRPRF
jgi:hypothetical protein